MGTGSSKPLPSSGEASNFRLLASIIGLSSGINDSLRNFRGLFYTGYLRDLVEGSPDFADHFQSNPRLGKGPVPGTMPESGAWAAGLSDGSERRRWVAPRRFDRCLPNGQNRQKDACRASGAENNRKLLQ